MKFDIVPVIETRPKQCGRVFSHPKHRWFIGKQEYICNGSSNGPSPYGMALTTT